MRRYESNWPSRRSIRMPAHDYSEPGDYFITVVVHDRACLFESLPFKLCVEAAWNWLSEQYPYVDLDEFVAMPNHLHGIISITDAGAGGSRAAPTGSERRKPLGAIVGAFKTRSTKQINLLRDSPGRNLWQRNYYEHLIRSEQELGRVRDYIMSNPAMWQDDPENPARYSGRDVAVRT